MMVGVGVGGLGGPVYLSLEGRNYRLEDSNSITSSRPLIHQVGERQRSGRTGGRTGRRTGGRDASEQSGPEVRAGEARGFMQVKEGNVQSGALMGV